MKFRKRPGNNEDGRNAYRIVPDNTVIKFTNNNINKFNNNKFDNNNIWILLIIFQLLKKVIGLNTTMIIITISTLTTFSRISIHKGPSRSIQGSTRSEFSQAPFGTAASAASCPCPHEGQRRKAWWRDDSYRYGLASYWSTRVTS